MPLLQRALLFLLCLLPGATDAATCTNLATNTDLTTGKDSATDKEKFNLARVVITGSKRYKEDDLVRATGLTVNTQVTVDDLQTAANRLGDSGAFATVQFLFKPVPGAKGLEADFQVGDADKFLPAVFENFVWISESELQQAVHQAIPLYNGQLPSSGHMSDEVSAALTEFLAARGLPSEVSYMLAGDFGQASSSYKFKVDNASLTIRDVTLTGATHALPEQVAKCVAPLKGIAYLRSDVAIVLEKNLVPMYRQQGYLKFTIDEIKPRADKDQVSVDVTVTEGDQYHLAGYSWAGNTLIPSEELSKHISMKPEKPIDALQLERDLIDERKLFFKFGREGISITPVAVFNDKAVTYTFTIVEGPQYHMGKLEIEGVDAPTTHKLAQGWKLAEGEPYDNTYIQQFLSHTVLKIPGHKWSWTAVEQIDDVHQAVNVHLQVKIE